MGGAAAAAAPLSSIFFLTAILLLPYSYCNAQSCKDYAFPSGRSFAACVDLPVLGAKLHWTYAPADARLTLAFRAPPGGGSGYVAWGLNPTSPRMVGTQALLAVHNSSGAVRAYTTNLLSSQPDMKPAALTSVGVKNLSVELRGDELVVFAVVTLPPGSSSTMNHAWQASTRLSDGDLPAFHGGGANYQSAGRIDFVGGATSTAAIPRKKKVHGVLNAIAWGTMMPIGAIIARYLRVFKSADPAWFYLHVACQCSAYGLGVAGWATGLKLGSESPGITHTAHRTMGIALFCMATLQVFALLLRPNKDHKYRIFWNVYHHFFGYATIIVSVINIFEGFDVLDDPDKKWKHVYTGVIATLGGIAVVLEVVTCGVVIRRRRRGEDKSHRGAANGHGSGV